MSNGSHAIWTVVPWPAWFLMQVSQVNAVASLPDIRMWLRLQENPLRDDDIMAEASPDLRSARLRKHADYQRVYKESRKHFSPSMSYFFRLRTAQDNVPEGPRVGLTAGRVFGKAVDRNRIKRRMREAVRINLSRLPQTVDVVLHPRKSVIDMEFAKLQREVARIFSTVTSHIDKKLPGKDEGARP
jgi:ribonuclease P protein component